MSAITEPTYYCRMTRVHAQHGNVLITSPNNIDISDGDTVWTDIYVPEDRDISKLTDIMDRPDWNEDQINAAIAEMQEVEG